MKYYTGVGSRETPADILQVIQELGEKLAHNGWVLRSGAADGADTAFEMGADVLGWHKEIYIAWDGFSGRRFGVDGVVPQDDCAVRLAYSMAETLHPVFAKLSRGAQALHSRNCFQVLGPRLDTPSKFLVCYAPTDKHGEPKGGTRTAWVLAKNHGIPCFNLYNSADLTRIIQWLQTM